MNPELFEKVNKHKPYLTSNNGMGFYNYLFTYLSSTAARGNKIEFQSYKSYSKLEEGDVAVLDSILRIDQTISNSQPYDTIRYSTLVKRAHTILHDTLIVDRTLQTINLLDSILEEPKADFLKIKITSKDFHDKELQIATVLNNTKTDWCKLLIKEQYAENVAKLKSINEILENSKPLTSDYQLGKPIEEMSFGAKLYKVDSLEPKQLLANLKNSFEGKAMIIDFWATWCGPCLGEMPHSKKLQNEVKELPVEFVYLCTSSNSNIDKWRSKIAEFEIAGTHIFVEQSIENELMNLFSVSGFPSYVLIDSKGTYKAGAISRMSRLDNHKYNKIGLITDMQKKT